MLTAVGIRSLQLKPISIAVLSLLGSAIDEAVSILSKYGGSLWVASPDYAFVNADGTGATTDDSAVGYVRDLCGNARPLTQATTGFKPKLKRVPKKLGPELVTNGDFAGGSTGWAGVTAGVSFSGGAVNIVSSSGEYQGITQNNILQSGKTYLAQADVVINSGVGGVTLASSAANVSQTTTGKLYGTFTAPTHYIEIKRFVGAVNATVDNVSVREVLEWTWAWVFDGSDDVLATITQPAAGSESFIVAKRLNALPASTGPYIFKRGTNQGAHMYATTTVYNNTEVGTGSAYAYRSGPLQAGHSVNSLVLSPTSRQVRVNAVSDGGTALTYEPAEVGIQIGAGVFFYQGEIFSAAYAPATIPDAELLIVEKAMAELSGITI